VVFVSGFADSSDCGGFGSSGGICNGLCTKDSRVFVVFFSSLGVMCVKHRVCLRVVMHLTFDY
jgi:hypothetical protein